jgi:hypothetical protein
MPRKIVNKKVKRPRQGHDHLIPKVSKTQKRYTKKGPKS